MAMCCCFFLWCCCSKVAIAFFFGGVQAKKVMAICCNCLFGVRKEEDNMPPRSLCDPKRVQRVGFAEMVRNLVLLPTSITKRGRGVVLEAPGLD
jgi:hypothetical protein